MTILKKITAIMLASVITVGGTVSAYATEDGLTTVNETTILDVNNKPETSIIDTGTKAETSIIDTESEKSETQPASGADLSDVSYTPIDVSTYKRWDGKTKMVNGTNYYISGKVAAANGMDVPKDSKLVVTPGSTLVTYKDSKFTIKGSLVIEAKATFSYSGSLYLSSKATLENYGKLEATVSSATNISSDLINRNGATAYFSGSVKVYSNGMYLNYGSTTTTKSSVWHITGNLQSPADSTMTVRGYVAVTLSGQATYSGRFYLYGEYVNSGVMIFEKTVKYYKAKSATLTASKSSSLIDYRYESPDGSMGDFVGGSKGIDVSYAQGAINWKQVKMSGINFAILRASRGYISDTKPMAQDVTFEHNVTEATKVGIEVGVYHYLYASTVEDARKEAKFFIETIKPYKITYPVILDVEEQYQANLGKAKITAICKAFLEEIEAAGYYPMIYANKAWLTNYLDMKQLSKYEVWLAQWNTAPTYSGSFGMWQYSSKGIVSGIDGYVDLNLTYKDYAKIIREGGYNHLDGSKEEADAA